MGTEELSREVTEESIHSQGGRAQRNQLNNTLNELSTLKLKKASLSSKLVLSYAYD